MPISRLAILLLLVAVCVVPVAAQSSLTSDSATLPPQLKSPGDSSDRIRVDQFHLPSSPLLGTDSHKTTVSLSGDPVPASMGAVHRFLAQDTSGDAVSICYSMRSYRVARDDPKSDSTRPAGYSTCQPSTRFQVKSVEDSPDLIKR
jgi:hypothetical protein